MEFRYYGPAHFCKFEKNNSMQEALFYKKEKDNKVKCLLCPWVCDLKAGQIGVCKVRRNNEGVLESLVYNKLAAFGIDPIEKKPLYHFYPGKIILSVGIIGCNLHCTFCQNHNISQCRADTFNGFVPMTAGQLLENTREFGNNIGIAYTYNEPFTFYEFMLETAQLMHSNGLKNVVVSNGYVNPEPLKQILPLIDAFNIDLKAFGNEFYQHQTKGKLEPVLESIKTVAKSKAHLEITNLVIPGLNDDAGQFESMVKWIAGETGNETPLHLSRYFPQYKLDIPATPPETLERLYQLAKQHLRYVYIGNLNAGRYSDTFCPECGKLQVKRNLYTVKTVPGFQGNCTSCGNKIPIVL